MVSLGERVQRDTVQDMTNPYGDGELEELFCTFLDAIFSLEESCERFELRRRSS